MCNQSHQFTAFIAQRPYIEINCYSSTGGEERIAHNYNAELGNLSESALWKSEPFYPRLSNPASPVGLLNWGRKISIVE
jgi:hypothetical protein